MEDREKIQDLKKKIKIADKIRVVFFTITVGLLAVSYFFMQKGAVPQGLVTCALISAVAGLVFLAVKFALIVKHNALVRKLK